MEELKFIQLPEWGTRILRFDFSGHTDFINELRAILLKDRFFSYIIASLLKSNSHVLTLEQLINSMGHEQFRRYIVHKILAKLKYNSYEQEYSDTEIHSILEFEKELSFLQTHGNSRILLLAIFLYLQEDGINLLKRFASIGQSFLRQKTRVVKPDFVLLSLYSLLQTRSIDQVTKLLENFSYDELFQEIGGKGQDHFIRSFIYYSYSIQESNFLKDKVV